MENGQLVAIVGLIIVVIGHLCSTVWWMSKITTTLDILSKSVEGILAAIAKHEATYYSKEDAAKDFAYRDKEIEGMWERVDEIKVSLDNCKAGAKKC